MSFRNVILLILAVFCWSCAQQGSPSGGPKDEDPPVVLNSQPENYSTRFTAKRIQITFDEYIVLDNVNQQLVVSPPMEEKPEVRLKGKTLIIQFEEDLRDSTTYTFNFGRAIKDLHEGNILFNYEYVFSTGEVLDSLSVRGTLKFAEDLKVPEESVTIMLYENLADSVPLTDIPLYVGRSNDSGVFSVNNLKADTFKVFALKDANYNLRFDLPTEVIGFLDTFLIVDPDHIRSILEAELPDSASIKGDSLAGTREEAPAFKIVENLDEADDPAGMTADPTPMAADSTAMAADSLDPGPDYSSIYIDIMLFTEEVETQYISEEKREDPRKILVSFARPLSDSFQYRFLEEERSIEVLEVFSLERDSLTLWLRDSVDYKNDSLSIELSYTVKDTLNQDVTQIDTLLMDYRRKEPKGKKGEKPEKEKLRIATLKNKGKLDLNTNLKMDLNFPLESICDSLINLWHIPDSVEIPIPFRSRADTLYLNRAWIDADWESAASYHIQLLPGALSSIYELEHDTINLNFSTRDIEYYGQILLTLENVSNPVIILLTQKAEVVKRLRVYESGLYTFSYLAPGDYGVKIIHDLNDNGKWDTGKYLEKRQPEPVEILRRSVTVRSNWDHDVTMTLEK